jgi:serine/threonine protein kinase
VGVLSFVVGDRVLPFPSESFVLGSGAGCAVRFSQLESKHAEVFFEDEAWQIRDISGTSSLRVDGVSTLEAKIDHGTNIKIGALKLVVRAKPVEVPVEDQTFIPTGGSLLAIGLVIEGRYQVLSKIAAGGMGAVYLVEHLELGKKFAMKVMLPELSRDPDFVSRFKREAMASSRIGHQNIVAISDFGRTQDGRFYFVMEYLEGMTLSELVRNEGAQPGERVIGIALQMGRALATAHAAGIIHRDLKPENIMLVQQVGRPDFVKVLDFGVAKVSSASGSEGKTAIGLVIGTPQYMSPEQASGLSVDARSDVYAMGLILYELVTGRPAFKAETPSMLLAMQITATPQPFQPGPLEETPELEALVHAMLGKKPSERPDSMDVVLNRLEALPLGGDAKKGGTTRLAPATVQGAAITLAAPKTLAEPAGDQTRDHRFPKTNTPAPSKTEFSPRVVSTEVSPRLERGQEPTPEELAIPRRTKWPLILALAVIVGGGGGYAWMSFQASRSSKPPVGMKPRPVEPVKPVEQVKPVEPVEPVAPKKIVPAVPKAKETAAVTFETKPDGAEVYEGEFLLGVTPFTLQREKGEVVVLRFVLKDHAPELRKVRFEDTARVRLELERKEATAAPDPAPRPAPKPAAPPREKAKPKEKVESTGKAKEEKKPASSELKDLPF